jgi:hypothetical protein
VGHSRALLLSPSVVLFSEYIPSSIISLRPVTDTSRTVEFQSVPSFTHFSRN